MTALSDAALEQLFSQVQEDYEKADRDYKPEPGDYMCLLSDLNVGKFEKNGSDCLFIQPVFVILGGQNDGRIFRERFTNQSPMAFQILRQFVEKSLTAEEYGLEPSGNLKDDLATLDSLKGRLILTVRTKRSKPSADGRTFINSSVMKVEGVNEVAEESTTQADAA